MQRYDVLLLDADGTLLDFHAAEKAAMRRCFISLGLPFDDTIHRRYSAINQSLWQQFERGEISKVEIGENRFQRVLDEFSIPFDGKRVEQAYREALGEEAQLVPGRWSSAGRLRSTAGSTSSPTAFPKPSTGVSPSPA